MIMIGSIVSLCIAIIFICISIYCICHKVFFLGVGCLVEVGMFLFSNYAHAPIYIQNIIF